MTEADYGEILVKWLKSYKYKVWQEVVISNGLSCDLVYLTDTFNTVEIKKELNDKVITQAIRWTGSAKSWVAIPYKKHTKSFWLKCDILHQLGIGLYEIDPSDEYYPVKIQFGASLIPRKQTKYDWSLYLSDEHADDVRAGSQRGERSSPFKRTCEMIERYKSEHPDADLSECIKNVKHHYSSVSSAKSSLTKYIKMGTIKLKGF